MQVRELAERYNLEKILHSTRAGTILRGTDTRTGRAVAVKLMTPMGPGSLAESARRFMAMGAALEEIRHPSLPLVVDHGLATDGNAFLVLEQLEGTTLDKLPPGDPGQTLARIARALDGVQALAERGLAHHNLCPENLFVVEAPAGESVKLLGLGSPLFRSTPPPEAARYQAPEATSGTADPRADVYSLALIACHALGATVASGDTLSVQMPFALALELDNDAALRQILERALSPDPAQRPTLRDMREAFRLALGVPELAPPISLPEPLPEPDPLPESLPSLPSLMSFPSFPDPAPEGELLPAITDDMLDALQAPPPAAPAAPVAAEPPARPRRLGLVAVLAVLALIAVAGLWLLGRRGDAPAAAGPASAAAPEIPSGPALQKVEQARLYLNLGEDDRARATLRSLTAAEQSALPPAACARLRALEETLARIAVERMPDDLALGLETGNLGLLRTAVEAGSSLGAALPAALRPDFERARGLVDLYARAEAAAAAKRPVEVLEALAAVEAQAPGFVDPLELRGQAAEAIETEAEALAAGARYPDALARLEPLLRSWPDRPGLADRAARYRAWEKAEPGQVTLLGNLAAWERRKKPHEGLDALAGVEPTPHLKPRFDQARQRLQNQLAQLDGTPPQIALREGYGLDYNRGTVAELSFRVTDDYEVRSVKLMARPPGGRMREMDVEKNRAGYYTVEIPPSFHQNGTVEIYVVAKDLSGHEGWLGSADKPLSSRGGGATGSRLGGQQRQPADSGVGLDLGLLLILLRLRLGLARVAEQVRLQVVLPGVEVVIAAAEGEQLLVAAALDDLPLLQHQDRVRPADGRQPVGDDEGRPPLHQLGQPFLDQRLALAVERRGRLVQDQDARIGQDRPRDRHPLPLAARELHPALADDRGVALRELLHELVAAGDARRPQHLLVRGVGPGVGDVLEHRAVEQEVVLEDHAEVGAVVAEPHLGEVVAVDQDRRPRSGGGRRRRGRSACSCPSPRSPTSAVEVPGRAANETPRSTGVPASYSNQTSRNSIRAHDRRQRLRARPRRRPRGSRCGSRGCAPGRRTPR